MKTLTQKKLVNKQSTLTLFKSLTSILSFFAKRKNLKKYTVLILICAFMLTSSLAKSQCSSYTLISNTSSPLISSISGTDDCGNCGPYCGFTPGDLRIGTGNPSTGFVEFTLTAPTQIIEVEVAALTNGSSSYEYVLIEVDGQAIDLNSGSVNFTQVAGNLFVTSTSTGQSGLIGVIEPTGGADCGIVNIDFECGIPAGSVVRISNISNGNAAGAYYEIRICDDAPSAGNCGGGSSSSCNAGSSAPVLGN